MALRAPTPTISPTCSSANYSIVYISKYVSYTHMLHKLASTLKVGTFKQVRYKILSLINKLTCLSWLASLVQCRNQFPHKVLRCDNNIVFELLSCSSIKNQNSRNSRDNGKHNVKINVLILTYEVTL